MKKLFMLLCIVIMFFGIAGCPENNNDAPPPNTLTTNVSSANSNAGVNTSNSDNFPAVPEPATLILLGTGLVGLAAYGRKRFKK